MLKASGAIDEDQVKTYGEKANIYLADQQEQYGPPREIEDRTIIETPLESGDSAEPKKETKTDETDPDEPSFTP